jgi:hypothetical protein
VELAPDAAARIRRIRIRKIRGAVMGAGPPAVPDTDDLSDEEIALVERLIADLAGREAPSGRVELDEFLETKHERVGAGTSRLACAKEPGSWRTSSRSFSEVVRTLAATSSAIAASAARCLAALPVSPELRWGRCQSKDHEGDRAAVQSSPRRGSSTTPQIPRYPVGLS